MIKQKICALTLLICSFFNQYLFCTDIKDIDNIKVASSVSLKLHHLPFLGNSVEEIFDEIYDYQKQYININKIILNNLEEVYDSIEKEKIGYELYIHNYFPGMYTGDNKSEVLALTSLCLKHYNEIIDYSNQICQILQKNSKNSFKNEISLYSLKNLLLFSKGLSEKNINVFHNLNIILQQDDVDKKMNMLVLLGIAHLDNSNICLHTLKALDDCLEHNEKKTKITNQQKKFKFGSKNKNKSTFKQKNMNKGKKKKLPQKKNYKKNKHSHNNKFSQKQTDIDTNTSVIIEDLEENDDSIVETSVTPAQESSIIPMVDSVLPLENLPMALPSIVPSIEIEEKSQEKIIQTEEIDLYDLETDLAQYKNKEKSLSQISLDSIISLSFYDTKYVSQKHKAFFKNIFDRESKIDWNGLKSMIQNGFNGKIYGTKGGSKRQFAIFFKINSENFIEFITAEEFDKFRSRPIEGFKVERHVIHTEAPHSRGMNQKGKTRHLYPALKDLLRSSFEKHHL
ncbi:MAG: hypothetical protein ACRYGR_10805 [Janthinobacterium lividum]